MRAGRHSPILALVLLVAVAATHVRADTTYDVLVDTRIKLGSEAAPIEVTPPAVAETAVRVFVHDAHKTQKREDIRTRINAQRRVLSMYATRPQRRLLSAASPLDASTNLVPGIDPVVDAQTGRPTIMAWFFVQRGPPGNQLVMQMRDGSSSFVYTNTQGSACGEDITDTCSFDMQITIDATCNDIVDIAAGTFSNEVFCTQKITFTPLAGVAATRAMAVVITIDIRKAVPTLNLSTNTTLTARLRYTNEKKLVVNPIELPTVDLHYAIGRTALVSHDLLSRPEPTFVSAGAELCTVITTTPVVDTETGKLTQLNADLAEVVMCVKSAPAMTFEVPPGSDSEPSFSCMAYAPNMRVSVIYSSRFAWCAANSGAGSRLGGCCDPATTNCGIHDAVNTHFQCIDTVTGAFTANTCTLAQPTLFTVARMCPTGQTCATTSAAPQPLVLDDFPIAPALFPKECLNPTATALVDCTTSTAGCLDAAGCTTTGGRLAVCFNAPTFPDVANKTSVVYEFRIDLSVVDFHQGTPNRRLLRHEPTKRATRTVGVTKQIDIINPSAEPTLSRPDPWPGVDVRDLGPVHLVAAVGVFSGLIVIAAVMYRI